MAPPTSVNLPVPCRLRVSRTGSAENTPRPVTRTGLPSASSNSTGSSSSTAGDGSGSWPGQGWRGSARGTGSSPSGVKVMRSAGPRPPLSTGTCTASSPSRPCTRTSARRARNRSSSPEDPHSGSCSAPAETTSTGCSRSMVIGAVGRSSRRCADSASRPVASAPGRRWHPRSAVPRTAKPGSALHRWR